MFKHFMFKWAIITLLGLKLLFYLQYLKAYYMIDWVVFCRNEAPNDADIGALKPKDTNKRRTHGDAEYPSSGAK